MWKLCVISYTEWYFFLKQSVQTYIVRVGSSFPGTLKIFFCCLGGKNNGEAWTQSFPHSSFAFNLKPFLMRQKFLVWKTWALELNRAPGILFPSLTRSVNIGTLYPSGASFHMYKTEHCDYLLHEILMRTGWDCVCKTSNMGPGSWYLHNTYYFLCSHLLLLALPESSTMSVTWADSSKGVNLPNVPFLWKPKSS